MITSTSPHEDPGRFLRALGDAYRASGRAAPIFDTLGHNAYPETTRESPYATHTTASLDQGDYVRLMQRAHGRVRRHRPARSRQRHDRDAGHRAAAGTRSRR